MRNVLVGGRSTILTPFVSMAVEHKSPVSQHSNESGDDEQEDPQPSAEEVESNELAQEEPKKKEDNGDDDEGEEKDTGEDENEESDDSKSLIKPESQTQVAPGEWQTTYSAPHNAWYFFNIRTGETTWTNPLQSPNEVASSSQPPLDLSLTAPQVSTSSNTTTDMTPMGQAALEQGIDPELAYLDPSLAYGPLSSGPGTFSARFNAHTGKFTAQDGRDPSHVSEYARAQRMSAVFFDVQGWEAEIAKRKADEDLEGPRRKRKPTKADLVSPHPFDFHAMSCSERIDPLATRNGSKRRRRQRKRPSMHGCENDASNGRTFVLVSPPSRKLN